MPENKDSERPGPNALLGPAKRKEISISVRSKIRALRSIAAWPFWEIGTELGVSSTTIYRICNLPSTPHKPHLGRPIILTTPIRMHLIEHATAAHQNCCTPLG